VLTTVLVVIAIVVAVLLAIAASRPDRFRVERSTQIQAAPDKVFPLINDFHRWGEWSPWEDRDPAMKKAYSGAAAGPGAVYEWEGNSKVGKGRMELLESSPSKIAIKLDFEKPFEGHNTAEYTLEPVAGGTRVTWAMFGPQVFIGKLMGLFVSMDKMIGRDFEVGLARLKAVAER
jgi:hypothetical protein